MHTLIRKCTEVDLETIFEVINEAAIAYRGVIPDDCCGDPYMPMQELRKEMDEMTFFGYEQNGRILGVAGYQPIKDVSLVRHVYVLPEKQRAGVGTKLLNYIMSMATGKRLLVGTWADASWAIRFYERHGFTMQANMDELLREYWNISERQVETSVVLGVDLPQQS